MPTTTKAVTSIITMLPTESPGFFTAFPSFHRVIARPRIVQNLLFALFYSIHQNTDFEKTEKRAVTPNAIFRMSIIEQKANSAQKTWTHTARLIA